MRCLAALIPLISATNLGENKVMTENIVYTGDDPRTQPELDLRHLDNTVLLNQLQEKTPDGLSGGKDGLLGTGDIFNRRSKESYVV
ncbi:hypothetical protein VY86_22240 [Photorhabdus thracensis]|uniref:Uncharacterized protein n=1 Tax=Photorhabdus thracensis TaxID=230089 RepID=A0A0F7LQX3_9GAMM|nr:hypothetical protein VY86_22240 [Photorhabdus thracensis]